MPIEKFIVGWWYTMLKVVPPPHQSERNQHQDCSESCHRSIQVELAIETFSKEIPLFKGRVSPLPTPSPRTSRSSSGRSCTTTTTTQPSHPAMPGPRSDFAKTKAIYHVFQEAFTKLALWVELDPQMEEKDERMQALFVQCVHNFPAISLYYWSQNSILAMQKVPDMDQYHKY